MEINRNILAQKLFITFRQCAYTDEKNSFCANIFVAYFHLKFLQI